MIFNGPPMKRCCRQYSIEFKKASPGETPVKAFFVSI
jgi:hypothetical protein